MEKPNTTGQTLATLQARRAIPAVMAVLDESPSTDDMREYSRITRQRHIDTARAATKAGW